MGVDGIDLLVFVFATIEWFSLIGRNHLFFLSAFGYMTHVQNVWEVFSTRRISRTMASLALYNIVNVVTSDLQREIANTITLYQTAR